MVRPRSIRLRYFVGLALTLGLGAAALRSVTAADHRDSAFLTANPASDIADVYSFVSPTDPSRVVLMMTVAGLIPPSEAASAAFDPEVVYTIKIDTDGDAVEDQVIQAYVTGNPTNQVMHFRGPAAPVTTGSTTRLMNGPETGTVRVSLGMNPETSSRSGMQIFAGLRDDPFFFDLGRFSAIVAGQAGSFNNPGQDTFAGTNVLAIAVEFPISALGGATSVGVWGTTSRPSN